MIDTFRLGMPIVQPSTEQFAPASQVVMPSDGTPPAKPPLAPDSVEHGTEPLVQPASE
jgi:hypothetical protein